MRATGLSSQTVLSEIRKSIRFVPCVKPAPDGTKRFQKSPGAGVPAASRAPDVTFVSAIQLVILGLALDHLCEASRRAATQLVVVVQSLCQFSEKGLDSRF